MGKAGIKPSRKLSFKDCFRLAEMIEKLDVKEKIVAIVSEAKGNPENAQRVGIEAFFEVIAKAPEVYSELSAFLADICGTEKETVESAPIAEVISAVKIIAAESDLKDFFTPPKS